MSKWRHQITKRASTWHTCPLPFQITPTQNQTRNFQEPTEPSSLFSTPVQKSVRKQWPNAPTPYSSYSGQRYLLSHSTQLNSCIRVHHFFYIFIFDYFNTFFLDLLAYLWHVSLLQSLYIRFSPLCPKFQLSSIFLFYSPSYSVFRHPTKKKNL